MVLFFGLEQNGQPRRLLDSLLRELGIVCWRYSFVAPAFVFRWVIAPDEEQSQTPRAVSEEPQRHKKGDGGEKKISVKSSQAT